MQLFRNQASKLIMTLLSTGAPAIQPIIDDLWTYDIFYLEGVSAINGISPGQCEVKFI